MNSSSNENVLYLALDEAVTRLIESGVVSLEEMAEAKEYYSNFIVELEAEWPPERIQAWRINREREKYQFYRAKKTELETANKEARTKGMSYQERQTYSQKIALLEKMLEETTQRGIALKKEKPLSARHFVKPFVDVDFIHSKGFEEHLKYRIL